MRIPYYMEYDIFFQFYTFQSYTCLYSKAFTRMQQILGTTYSNSFGHQIKFQKGQHIDF